MEYWEKLVLAVVDIGIAAHTVDCARAQLSTLQDPPGYRYVGPKIEYDDECVRRIARMAAMSRSAAIRNAITACRARNLDEQIYTIDNFRNQLIQMNATGITFSGRPSSSG